MITLLSAGYFMLLILFVYQQSQIKALWSRVNDLNDKWEAEDIIKRMDEL